MADMPPVVATATEIKAWRAALKMHFRTQVDPRRCLCVRPWPCSRRAELRGWLIACGAGIEEETK